MAWNRKDNKNALLRLQKSNNNNMKYDKSVEVKKACSRTCIGGYEGDLTFCSYYGLLVE